MTTPNGTPYYSQFLSKFLSIFMQKEAFNHSWIQRQNMLHNLVMRNYIDSVNLKYLIIAFLQAGVHHIKGCMLTEEDVEQAMNIMDSNNMKIVINAQKVKLDYTEFIAACLQSYNYLKENHLKTAFTYFDKDGSGSISIDELKHDLKHIFKITLLIKFNECLQNEDFTLPEETILRILQDVDIDGNKLIDYNEFIIMMKTKSELSKSVLGQINAE